MIIDMVRPVVKAPKPLLGPRTAGVIALLLVPVAAAAAAGAVAAPAIGDAAAMAALEHAGLADPDSPFLTTVSVPLFPLVLAALVLGIAEAFRRGAVIADDVDGLV
jgi:hypothetical protein